MKYIEYLDTYSNRDKPLSFHWKTLDDTWQDNLGLPPARSDIHEMKRQNLRQIDVASRIGLSRPQLTNALHGRFGVGMKAAAALKAFVLEEATPA